MFFTRERDSPIPGDLGFDEDVELVCSEERSNYEVVLKTEYVM